MSKLAPIVLAAFALAACGGSASQATTAAPPVAPATTEAVVATSAEAATSEVTTEAVPAETAAATKLNLNTVTGDELLAKIPGFGNRMVREFQEYRPYISIAQFRKEIGKYVDANQVAEYEKYVYVPVKPNDADEATLQQLPGVDAAIAAQLVAARPYDSNDAFLKKLGELTTADNAAAAAAYLETK